MDDVNGADNRTTRDMIREYLEEHPNAQKREVQEALAATGRNVHSPDLTYVRKQLGIVWPRGAKSPTLTGQSASKDTKPRAPRMTPVVQATVRTPDGLQLLVGIVELAKIHGMDKVRQAAEAASSI